MTVDGDPTVLLPPHSDGCMGCGPGNRAGLQMRIHRHGDEVFTDIVFDTRQAGAPGLVHGGAVAAACDDLFGFVLHVVETPAVTRSLQVDYRAPVPLGVPHRITARQERRDGRKLYLVAEGVAPDGTVRFTAEALFLAVTRAHFERFGTFEDHPGLERMRWADKSADDDREESQA